MKTLHILATIANLIIASFTIYDSILNGMNWINGLCLAINLAALIALIKTRKYL